MDKNIRKDVAVATATASTPHKKIATMIDIRRSKIGLLDSITQYKKKILFVKFEAIETDT